jgi:hypothetical protein
MTDKTYYDAQDVDRTQPLSRQQAAQVQYAGHVVVEEDGTPVTLYAHDILHGTEAETHRPARGDAQYEAEALKADSEAARDEYPATPVGPEGSEDAHPDAVRRGGDEDAETVHPKRSEGDAARVKLQAQADGEDPDEHTVSHRLDGSDPNEGLHNLSIPEIKEKIEKGDITDEELAQLRSDERKGAREAADKAIAERGGTLGTSVQLEDEDDTADADEGYPADAESDESDDDGRTIDDTNAADGPVADMLASQQEALQRPPDSEEARALAGQATVADEDDEDADVSGDATAEGDVEDDGSAAREGDSDEDREEA